LHHVWQELVQCSHQPEIARGFAIRLAGCILNGISSCSDLFGPVAALPGVCVRDIYLSHIQ